MIRNGKMTTLALVGLLLVGAGCHKVATDTFTNGTYTGTVGQTLVISGEDFTYTVLTATLSGHYVIDGSTVTFITTKIGGQNTGIEQKATYDFTTTANSITLSNMRDEVNGGSGIAPDTFTK
jgi:hypothetical protein